MVRLKNRYIVGKIIPEKDEKSVSFNENLITQNVLSQVEKNYGIFGKSALENGFRIKYCNDETRIVIIRCRHGPHRFVTSILPLMLVFGNHRAKFSILYIGATIMQCNKFIIKYQRNYLNQVVSEIKSAKERQDFIDNVMDFDLE
ncbi:ribonuclease P/MRP protein subunit POP5 [Condylostylus longicornis]|uniref:ribonuclease P/MRP protein subunit POP5 n=1 Tax=Condylostylus longicornis TaxID=2530218 RepID=UPI00244DE238|nr:ribonuclease P/MRP protein subunit POP5 [Condylostylus longicornis]